MIDLAQLLSPNSGFGRTTFSAGRPWSRHWSSRSTCVILGLGCLLSVSGALSGQDPFGTADPFGTTPSQDMGAGQPTADATPFGFAPAAPAAAAAPAGAAAAAAAPVAEETDPLVRSMRLLSLKTPEDFAQALQTLVRIQRWDEVGRYLDKLQQAGWNRDQLAELSRAGGASLWFHIRDAGSELTAAQQKFVSELAALPAQLSRDPQWIDGWINRLASPSPVDRGEAQIRLEQANRAAIERLASRLLAGDRQVPGMRLVESLLDFGADGVEALRAACVAADPDARARVLLALAQSTARDFGVELGSALYSTALSQEARTALAQALEKKYGKLPKGTAVYEYLISHFKRQLDDYQLARAREAHLPVRVWRVTADGQSVAAVDASAAERSLESLAQVAAHRIVLDMRTSDDLVESATVLLQHGYQSRPGVATDNPVGNVLMGLPAEASGSDFWKQVLDRSKIWQMHGASIRAAQAIGSQLANTPEASPSFDFNAECLRDSRPVMRFVAVEAIARAGIGHPYNGVANALETAIEMSRLAQGPTVLVIGLTAELRQAADQQLLALGAQPISVNSTQAALEILDQPYPVELIMIVDRVPRNSLLVLVERLRHSRRGGSLPIAILTDQLRSFETTELPRYPGVVMSVLSRDPEHMPRIISELERHLDVRPLSPAERAAFAQTANTLLATIAADRARYDFYPLARWEDELLQIADALPVEAWLTVLGGLGTLDSQQRLSLVAADESRDAETRQQAAKAFTRSVKQFGLLLDRPAVWKAYDLYNTQGPHDPVTVTALGQVLDAIETRTGTAEAANQP
ncbi:MAG: hypothetical protein ACTHOU_01275 [Aureliella sp.]